MAPIADRVGFDTHLANRLEVVQGRLTGELVPPIFDAWGKAEMLRRLTILSGVETFDTLAVGDGANDALMVERAALGVAFRAKPVLEEKANAVIRHGDLTALLYLQGYRLDEIVRQS